MGENLEDQTGDVEMSSSDMVFDNLTIMKEFSNIANLVGDDDFLETVPKAKLKRVKWAPMFNCLKQGILEEMVQELSAMWKFENMPQKLETLNKQIQKFSDVSPDTQMWRPQLNNVQAQLKAHDVANLRKQKALLESLATEYDNRVDRLKKNLTSKRGYLKALQLDMQKYQKKNDAFISLINEKLESHSHLAEKNCPSIDLDDINWNSDLISE